MAELIDPSNYQDFTLQTIMTPDGITRINNILRQLSQNISGDTESVRVFSGVGTPEASIAAGIGSLYMRTDGGADTAVYRKETGSGNTGWVAVKSPASLPLSTANGGLGADASGWTAGDLLYLSATGTIGHTTISKFFTSSGTFVATTNKVVLTMTGGGAGGGSGGSGTDGGGGGAAACAINFPFTVTPGNSYTVTIGAGGASDTNGGATSFDTITVAGGTKGASGSAASNGGSGAGSGWPSNAITTALATATLVTIQGGNGYKAAGGGVGGAGGSTLFGKGGDAVNGSIGGAGTGFGSAGAGGSQTGQTAGGVGANGFCLVQSVN